MARIEKTVFISYRRQDVSWALAVYQNLTACGYDVFFDYTSISSGKFEQIILSNIKARAHFLVILTPSALERCCEEGDWLRREIETAIVEKRNIVPLLCEDFDFKAPEVKEKLTGTLAVLQEYNGLEVPAGFFVEAMRRLRERYLNVMPDGTLHPVSPEVQRVVRAEQVAVNRAIQEEEAGAKKEAAAPKAGVPAAVKAGLAILLLAGLVLGGKYIAQHWPLIPGATPAPTETRLPASPTAADTAVPAPTPGIGSTLAAEKDGMSMLYVPGGEFLLGSEGGDLDEKPVHPVSLEAFWIDQTEVTNGMYALCVGAGACTPPSDPRYSDQAAYRDHPVVFVDWNQARTYCEWAGRRLPTEAEWEKAASWDESRQEKYVYPWGDSIDCTFTNYWGQDGGCAGETTKVGSYPEGASPYGVLDMAGDAWEWVSSLYKPYPYEAGDGREDLASHGSRVIRGGSWVNDEYYLRSAFRDGYVPTFSVNYLGFRCGMDARP